MARAQRTASCRDAGRNRIIGTEAASDGGNDDDDEHKFSRFCRHVVARDGNDARQIRNLGNTTDRGRCYRCYCRRSASGRIEDVVAFSR